MNIVLNKLTLENFKGVKSFTLEPRGRSLIVRGDNATGKTTLMDGFLWLLFGKDSQGKADFAIKTLDKDGQEIHNLNHSVEAELNIDGEQISLKKVFKEKWQKHRGSPKPIFTGHTTDNFINGVPIQEKEWKSRIQAIIDEDTFKLLTSPTYFNSLHWTKRRQILLQVCGDVKDAEVIASDRALAELPEILGNRSMEEHRKIVTAMKKDINDRLREIPARIDELDKSLASVLAEDKSLILGRISQLETEIQKAKDDTRASALRKQKAELQAKLAEAQAVTAKQKENARSAIDKVIRDLREAVLTVESNLRITNQQIRNTERIIRENEQEMTRLRDLFSETSKQNFQGPSVCPACGQSLPQDQVEEAIAKYNQNKADQLADINRKGSRLKSENEKYSEDLAKLVNSDKSGYEMEIERLKSALATQEKAAPIVEKNKAVETLTAEIDTINEALNAAPRTDTSSLEASLKAERQKLAEIDAAKKTQVRIAELGREEKALAAEYERLEKETFLMERFIMAKVNLLEDRINDSFALARFKMFDTLLNGGISETCVTLYDGVPYGAGLNTGAEINVGLDIIKTLSRHYGVNAPVFVDHAESVTALLDPGSQTIKLAVDEAAKTLEVNYDN